uniref:LanC-like protein 2 n=1 Tax=Crassostrea virginica TaxID=6565 RepID=A0A8B8C6K7_CRAVI|nr:lanC-like protein 2 [Crassostrea virginica]
MDRYFKNQFKEWDQEKDNGNLIEPFREKFRKKYLELLEVIERAVASLDDTDGSVYTGTAGIALLYLHLYEIASDKGDHSLLHKSLEYIKGSIDNCKRRKLTFLCGDSGPLALAVVIYSLLGESKKSKKYRDMLTGIGEELVSRSLDFPGDELFKGRAGCLYALLFVKRKLGDDTINKDLVMKIVDTIFESGISLAREEKWQHPLMYRYHEKHYYGAAHGMAGILYLLLTTKEPSLQKRIDSLVKPTVDYMLTLQFSSGNCPSSLQSSSRDRLVQWCHGAPGWVYMFLEAYKRYQESHYLEAAKRCADVIWSRGLLQKGYGLCHGTAGNAYAFLAMYKLTKSNVYLYRAIKFAEWCCDYGRHGCRTPDRPYSLYEGMAGTAYFLSDILVPDTASFPAFELT